MGGLTPSFLLAHYSTPVIIFAHYLGGAKVSERTSHSEEGVEGQQPIYLQTPDHPLCGQMLIPFSLTLSKEPWDGPQNCDFAVIIFFGLL